MIKFKLVFSLLLLLLLGYAQVHAQFTTNAAVRKSLENIRVAMYTGGTDPTGGSSLKDYYDKEWTKANITFYNNVTEKFDKVRYNLNKQILEFQVKENIYSLPVNQVNKLVFTSILTTKNKTFLFNKEKEKLGLLELITKYKNISLVAAYSITKKMNENKSGYTTSSNTSEGTKTTKYYLLSANESLFKLTNNKKKNAKFFAEHWVQLENFIKKNKLSFKKQDDITKIINFYVGLDK